MARFGGVFRPSLSDSESLDMIIALDSYRVGLSSGISSSPGGEDWRGEDISIGSYALIVVGCCEVVSVKLRGTQGVVCISGKGVFPPTLTNMACSRSLTVQCAVSDV